VVGERGRGGREAIVLVRVLVLDSSCGRAGIRKGIRVYRDKLSDILFREALGR